MSDWAVIRLDLENPDEAELVTILANVPMHWYDYMETQAIKPGRYVAAKILYQHEYYQPPSARKGHKDTEEDSDR